MRGMIKRWWLWLGICFFYVAIAAGYLFIPSDARADIRNPGSWYDARIVGPVARSVF
jgi:hypothetical protein